MAFSNLFWKWLSFSFEWYTHSVSALFLQSQYPIKMFVEENPWLKNIYEDFFDSIFGHVLFDSMSPPWLVPWFTTIDFSGGLFCFGSTIFFLFDFCLIPFFSILLVINFSFFALLLFSIPFPFSFSFSLSFTFSLLFPFSTCFVNS